MVVVGLIRGFSGLHGEVRVEIATADPQRFSPGTLLFVGDTATQVQKARKYKKGIVLKLEGIDDRNQAEALMGQPLLVPEEDVPPLPEGDYYYFQILDMQVWTREDEFLGTIQEILHTGSNDVYVVRQQKQEVLVPALEDVILEVDVKKQRMVVDLPEGLR